MPIKIQADLPAREILESENIFVMTEKRALSQDIRPLKIAIVNLMPTKETTETQILRLLANTPLQVEVSLVKMDEHISKNADDNYLKKFYISSKRVFEKKFDGMIITGAPVEQMEFEAVDYWNELCAIMDYAKKNVYSTLYVCWGSFAGLYHLYGIKKFPLAKKMFGVFENHRMSPNEPLLRGFDDTFPIPQSRWATVDINDVKKNDKLQLLASSDESGVSIVKSKTNREIFMTGHLEYDTETLAKEYFRDKAKNETIEKPLHYFPRDNENENPHSVWRSTAHLFYSNWLNYYVYQETPFSFA